MKIKYKTSMDDAVTCHIRYWWSRKSSKRRLIFNLSLFPIVWLFFAISSDFDILRTLMKSALFTIFLGPYLLYAFGPGFRRKMRKHIKESLQGRPFPEYFECDLSEKGISTSALGNDIHMPWENITDIREYKDNIEVQGIGCFLHLKKEHAPTLEEIHDLWKRYQTASNQTNEGTP